MKWSTEMEKLLLWMRKQDMSFSFCAEVIGRETKCKVSTHACNVKHQKLMKRASS